MSQAHDRASTPSVQPQIAHSLQSLIAVAMSIGGGICPEKGIFTPKVWAALIGKNPGTIRSWVEKYDIEVRMPGDEMLIDAVDLLAKIPKKKWSELKSKRGGDRRSKKFKQE